MGGVHVTDGKHHYNYIFRVFSNAKDNLGFREILLDVLYPRCLIV